MPIPVLSCLKCMRNFSDIRDALEHELKCVGDYTAANYEINEQYYDLSDVRY